MKDNACQMINNALFVTWFRKEMMTTTGLILSVLAEFAKLVGKTINTQSIYG